MTPNSKIYVKRGNLNYKERKYIKAIQDAIEEKGIDTKDFVPANNFEQLSKLYEQMTITDASFEEVNGGGEGSEQNQGGADNSNSSGGEGHGDGEDGNDNNYSPDIDPLNREAPIVRDYVMDNTLKDNPNAGGSGGQTQFGEPTTFGESFEMPKDEGGEGRSGSLSSKGDKGDKGDKEKKTKPEPINPDFDKMPDAKKRKNTKKFAKAIVKGVCKLAEMGCIWWVTKDITDDKLIGYELNDEMDMQLLLTLENDQRATVKTWLQSQVKLSKTVFKITQEEEDDLADSLYEVMLDKGIAPTPMQELIMNAVSTLVIGLGVKAYAMQEQIGNVLAQLREIKADQKRAPQEQEIYHEDNHNNPATDFTDLTDQNQGEGEGEGQGEGGSDIQENSTALVQQ